MLNALGYSDLKGFITDVVPDDILDPAPPYEALPEGCGEAEALRQLKELSPVLHYANLVASEMIHFVHQLAYYITFEVERQKNKIQ